MLSSGREPEWREFKGLKIPVAGERKEELKALRKLGPQGQSTEEWEQYWRAGHGAHYRDLIVHLQRVDPEDRLDNIAARCMLVGARLDRADLSAMDLRNMNLSNSSFRGAILDGSNLQKTQLVKADFSRASLHVVDFSGAVLDGSDLTGAYAKGALFEGASVRRVWFRRAYLDGCLFYEADLRLSDFALARCWGARFDGANLEDAHGFESAVFVRWLRPGGRQVWLDTEVEGWHAVYENPMGQTSYQVNAGRRNE